MAGRGVLQGAFAVLEALNALGGDAGLAELARAVGLPKTTAHRLLGQLVDFGVVERAPAGYRTGSLLFRLGQSWEPELRELARDWLPVLAARIRAGVLLVAPGLVVIDGTDVPAGTVLPPDSAAGRLWTGIRGFAVDAGSVAVPVRAPDGSTAAGLVAVLPPGRGPQPVVAGLMSTARAFGAALTA
ncbi:helix-turn-helix domain-containing protein [Amycolatopsis sp. NPDC004169]|uniref:helix-turn-helix domain-containing protein n=1 Tax=Amycolatopsis sp. NPDC004169 TaxID=3154453 RepID=UPI0033A1120F